MFPDVKFKDLHTEKIFWEGYVENITDPKGEGRMQVRWEGLHTEQLNETPLKGIKTEHLPWARRLVTSGDGSISGHGKAPKPFARGSYVSGYFQDPGKWQSPIVIGVLHGTRLEEADPTKGFNDPTGKYPRKDRLNGEGDQPFELSEERKRLGETYFDVISEDIEEDNPDGAKTAFGLKDWKESGPSSDPEAEYNQVDHKLPRDYESDDIHDRIGHVSEVDSTPNRERAADYYAPSGSFREVDTSGKESTRYKGGREAVIFGSKEQIKGERTLTIEGAEYVLVEASKYEEILGRLTERIESMEQTISGSKRVDADTVTHHCNVHKLSNDTNTQPMNNLNKCLILPFLHFTQEEVLGPV